MITGVVLARNEEVNIEACLRSFRPHVDQLIVIDMESSDATTRIAERLADRVISHPLIDDFDSARNVAIQHTPHPWLWFLDADERVSPQTAGIVRNLAGSLDDSFAAIQIPFKTYFCGQWIRHSGWWPGYTMPRVFRRGRFEFRKGVHQGVAVDGKTALFPPDPETAIEHFSYRSIEHYFEKFNRYTTIEAQSLVSREDASWDWRVGMRQMTRDLWHYYENCRGDLDGLNGWVLAWLAGQYRWASHAKVLDALRDRDVAGSVPADLSEVVREIENELCALRVRRPPVGEIGIVLRSPLLDATGYADDGRFVASVLARLEYSVQAEEIRWREDVATLTPATQALIRALLRAKTPRNRITITNCIPTLVQPDPLAHLNILRTTFETDRIPEEWLDRLDGFDEIWLFSEANREAFIRGGAAPERIRLVPSGLDTELFSPTGAKCALPAHFEQRFKILSILDWQYRKGWDLLVAAVLDEFKSHRDVGLILKVTTDHGASLGQIEAAIDDLRNQLEPEVRNQVAISILAQSLTALEMAELYRAVDLFALPSRGEGWGRPLLEAMACGIPVLTTEGSGQAAFLDNSCALLVESTWCEVPDHAWHQVPTFKGHRWLEPNFSQLKQRLRQAYDEPDLRQRLAKSGLTRAREQYSIDASRSKFAHAVESAQSCWFPSPAPVPSPDRVRVAIEGEFFAGHSFSNVNEEIARHVLEWQQTELTLTPLWHEHASTTRLPHLQSLKSYFHRDIGEVDVTLRHSFPPRWDRPKTGRWIHIQPWEFGALPLDWIQPLRDDVDEIWLPSNYCRDVFVASGVPADKIQVIPWGIDSATYHPQAIPRALPAAERFQFLFMGGTITRKGFDVLLQAYLEEFTETDQVQLVVKDMGTKSFYRDDNHRERLLQHIARGRGPKIHYIDREMTAGQRASLYTASDCLVAPYRGEGFGLPILEAMACGVMPIIPDQGPATEFVPVDASIRLPAKTQECLHGWRLAGVGTEISIEVSDLRDAMRRAYENRQLTRDMGIRAAQHAHENYPWREISRRMAARLQLVGTSEDTTQATAKVVAAAPTLTACILHDNQQLSDLIETLGSVRHWCREIIITTTHVTDDLTAIAQEYRARLYPALPIDLREHRLNSVLRRSTSDWVLWLDAGESVSLTAASEIKSLSGNDFTH